MQTRRHAASDAAGKWPTRALARHSGVHAAALALAAATLFVGPACAGDLGIVQTADLRFGDFVALGPAVVVVPPNGFAHYVDAVAAGGGRPRAARFELAGDAAAWVEVQLPAGPVRIRLAGGEALVRDFVVEASGDAGLVSLGGGRYRLRLDPGGARSLDVGASLHLGSATSEGEGLGGFAVVVTAAP